MGMFMSGLPCGGFMYRPDNGKPSFDSCGDEHCIHCGDCRRTANKFRKHVTHWLLPHTDWGKKGHPTFGIHEVANHILEGDVAIRRNHNIVDEEKGWYNVTGTITLPFSVLITDDELISLQQLWELRGKGIHPVDQNLDHPAAPKPNA